MPSQDSIEVRLAPHDLRLIADRLDRLHNSGVTGVTKFNYGVLEFNLEFPSDGRNGTDMLVTRISKRR